MRKIVFTLLSLCLTLPIFSQNPIGIDRIINDLDWENCSEADVILAFKDNIEKREKDEVWDNGDVSSFILKNVKVGESLSNANIIVNKFNRKLIKIGGIIIGKEFNWNRGSDVLSKELEDLLSSFWGKEYTKRIEYDSYLGDCNIVYPEIRCEWGDSHCNDKTSKGSFLLIQKTKFIVIAIEPK